MIRSLQMFHVAVPLRTRIKHASHDRTVSDNLIVKVTLDSGHEGHGEGVPRDYVTGETIATTFAALSAFDVAQALGKPTDFDDAVARVAAIDLPETQNDPRQMFGNAARCALEIALLDALGRKYDKSVSDAVRLLERPGVTFHPQPRPVRYSGAITAASTRKERVSAFKMRIYGFHQVKVKVGVEGQDDASRLAALRRILGRRMDVRIDANEAWSPDEVVERVAPLLRFSPSVLEQPIPHEVVGTLAEIRPRLGLPVMLDESLCSIADARTSIRDRTTDLFNVRLSKCGGISRLLEILGLGFGAGLGAQLGCHPGETGILSAAGRHVATNVDGLRFVEGSYDRHVLDENPIVEDITFRYGGWAPPLSGPGLGIQVDRDTLRKMTIDLREITFD